MESEDQDQTSVEDGLIPEKILEQVRGNDELTKLIKELYRKPGAGSRGRSSENIRVLICSCSDILREGMKTAITRENDLALVGEVDHASASIEKVDGASPDVVVMDVYTPGMPALEACAKIKSGHPSTKIILLATFTDYKYIRESLKAGADGFLPDRASSSELIGAIRSVNGGSRSVSPRVLEAVLDRVLEHLDSPSVSVLGRLTERELEVLELVSEGLRNKEIASRLSVSLRTIEKITSDTYRKLEVDSRGAAIRLFLESYRDFNPGI